MSQAPIFRYDGDTLHTQFADMLVFAGYDVAGETMDAKGREAIAALTAIIEEPNARHDFLFEPGQIQIVDNRRLGHRRTAFTDWPEPERRRHLVRLWVRNSGGPSIWDKIRLACQLRGVFHDDTLVRRPGYLDTMCGRYSLTSPIESMRALFGFDELPNLRPR